jgi:ABC-2 type transport system permease protein
MERFVEVFRNFLYDNRWPDPSDGVFIFLAALIMFAVGFLAFSKNEKRLAELL